MTYNRSKSLAWSCRILSEGYREIAEHDFTIKISGKNADRKKKKI